LPQGTPDRITKRNLDGETAEDPRIVRGVLYKIGVGGVNIHVRGDNPYSYRGRMITQHTNGHVHFGQQFLPQGELISTA